jgi:hypothetical protein
MSRLSKSETRSITTLSARHDVIPQLQMKGDRLMKKLFLLRPKLGLHYCSSRRLAVGFAVLVTVLMTVAAGSAASINNTFNTTSLDAVPVLNAGWVFDQVDAVMAPSESSPYVFTLASSAFFRITDQFVPGDVYDVFDSGTLVLMTTFNGAQSPLSPVGDPMGQAGWTSALFSHGQLLLAPGAHSITVEDTTGAFGIPAGFFTRLDSAPVNTPEPSALVLLGIALTGLGAFGLRRKS